MSQHDSGGGGLGGIFKWGLILVGGYAAYEYIFNGVDIFAGLFGGVAATPAATATNATNTPATTATTTTNPITGTATQTPVASTVVISAGRPIPVTTSTPTRGSSDPITQLTAAAGKSSGLTFNQWNYYFNQIYGGYATAPSGTDTTSTAMTVQQFLSMIGVTAGTAPTGHPRGVSGLGGGAIVPWGGMGETGDKRLLQLFPQKWDM